jgi:alkyldihydroxyacetonephosphate synthase
VRRWNGWSEEGVDTRLPSGALQILGKAIGPGRPQPEARFEDVVAAVPASRLGDDPLLSTEAADRVRHARGQSLPDWVALRSGRIGWLPDAVARPTSDDDVHRLFGRAARAGAILIP